MAMQPRMVSTFNLSDSHAVCRMVQHQTWQKLLEVEVGLVVQLASAGPEQHQHHNRAQRHHRALPLQGPAAALYSHTQRLC